MIAGVAVRDWWLEFRTRSTAQGNMNQYGIERKGNILIFETVSFKAEKRSFLHSGIFSRELASSFVASGVAILYLLFTALFQGMPGYPQYAVAAFIILVVFPLSRAFLFREPLLRMVMDRERDEIMVSKRGLLDKRIMIKRLTELKDVMMNSVRFEAGNSDAVDFVTKIALQHGTVVPGFGEADRFYTVDFIFDDEMITVFASKSEKDAESVRMKLKHFAFSQGMN